MSHITNQMIDEIMSKKKPMPVLDLPLNTDDPYIIENDEVETASKLKLFRQCPFAYWLKYVMKYQLEPETPRHFIVGNAVDAISSFGYEYYQKKFFALPPNTDRPAKLDEKGEKMKDNEGNTVFKRWYSDQDKQALEMEIETLEAKISEAKSKNRGTKTNEGLLEKAQDMLSQMDQCIGKELLTNSEGEMIDRIYEEMKRQPLFRYMDKDFLPQVRVEADFKTDHGVLKIGGTMDRLHKKKGAIYDTKTCRDQGRDFYRDVEFAIRDFDYLLSMNFYRRLCQAHRRKNPDLPEFNEIYLDFFSKGKVAKYLQVQIDESQLEDVDKEIFGVNGDGGLLRFLARCKAENYFPLGSSFSGFADAHLKSPYYELNEGAIQTQPVYYQEPSYV